MILRCFRRSVPLLAIIVFSVMLFATLYPEDSHARSLVGSLGKTISSKIGRNTGKAAGNAAKHGVRRGVIKQLPRGVANSFHKGAYTQRRLKEPLVLYRYHGKHNATPRRHTFLTPGKYKNELDARRSLAIPTVPAEPKGYRHLTRVTTYRLPKGTLVSEGKVARYGRYSGGGKQVVVEKPPGAWKIKDQMFSQFRKSHGLK